MKNILGNKQKRYHRRAVFRYYRAGFVLCLIIMSLIYCATLDINKTSPEAVKQTKTVGVVEVKAVEDKYTSRGYAYCYDPITCIRDVGDELKMDNKDIITMIRIAKCESNYRPDAVGVNTNKTIDRGVFQLNSIHKDISNSDAFDFIKNIKYAWNMYQKQGTTPWNSSKHCWNI